MQLFNALAYNCMHKVVCLYEIEKKYYFPSFNRFTALGCAFVDEEADNGKDFSLYLLNCTLAIDSPRVFIHNRITLQVLHVTLSSNFFFLKIFCIVRNLLEYYNGFKEIQLRSPLRFATTT